MICDLNLAGESGIGLLRWLERNHPATAVLVAGGAGDPQAAATALASGAYGVVRKPFDKEGLALGVAEALRQRR